MIPKTLNEEVDGLTKLFREENIYMEFDKVDKKSRTLEREEILSKTRKKKGNPHLKKFIEILDGFSNELLVSLQNNWKSETYHDLVRSAYFKIFPEEKAKFFSTLIIDLLEMSEEESIEKLFYILQKCVIDVIRIDFWSCWEENNLDDVHAKEIFFCSHTGKLCVNPVRSFGTNEIYERSVFQFLFRDFTKKSHFKEDVELQEEIDYFRTNREWVVNDSIKILEILNKFVMLKKGIAYLKQKEVESVVVLMLKLALQMNRLPQISKEGKKLFESIKNEEENLYYSEDLCLQIHRLFKSYQPDNFQEEITAIRFFLMKKSFQRREFHRLFEISKWLIRGSYLYKENVKKTVIIKGLKRCVYYYYLSHYEDISSYNNSSYFYDRLESYSHEEAKELTYEKVLKDYIPSKSFLHYFSDIKREVIIFVKDNFGDFISLNEFKSPREFKKRSERGKYILKYLITRYNQKLYGETFDQKIVDSTLSLKNISNVFMYLKLGDLIGKYIRDGDIGRERFSTNKKLSKIFWAFYFELCYFTLKPYFLSVTYIIIKFGEVFEQKITTFPDTYRLI